jgi:hypothetical protein
VIIVKPMRPTGNLINTHQGLKYSLKGLRVTTGYELMLSRATLIGRQTAFAQRPAEQSRAAQPIGV